MSYGNDMACNAAIRVTAASEILEMASSLTNRANSIQDRVHGKLQPVMVPPVPQEITKGPDIKRLSPPLFNELQSLLYGISSSLDSIEEALSRTEL